MRVLFVATLLALALLPWFLLGCSSGNTKPQKTPALTAEDDAWYTGLQEVGAEVFVLSTTTAYEKSTRLTGAGLARMRPVPPRDNLGGDWYGVRVP